MARSHPSARAGDTAPDAIALLKQDHRTVESLFEEFSSAEEADALSIAERVCQLLTIHAQIEEELLYPAASQAFEDDEEQELIAEAQIEHGSAKELIAKIEEAGEDDAHLRALVTVLGEYVKHHVKEEENELFPKLKKAGIDLKQLGGRLAERKYALMEEMDVAAEEPEAPARKRAARSRGGRAGTTRARHSRHSNRGARH